MGDRIKILGAFAVLGFMGGIIANVGFHTVWPWLAANIPSLFASEVLISGIAGALITTFFVVIWVYLSRPSPQQ